MTENVRFLRKMCALTLTTAPHIATISGLLIFIAVIGFNLVGDGIRDVMDPKMKK